MVHCHLTAVHGRQSLQTSCGGDDCFLIGGACCVLVLGWCVCRKSCFHAFVGGMHAQCSGHTHPTWLTLHCMLCSHAMNQHIIFFVVHDFTVLSLLPQSVRTELPTATLRARQCLNLHPNHQVVTKSDRTNTEEGRVSWNCGRQRTPTHHKKIRIENCGSWIAHRRRDCSCVILFHTCCGRNDNHTFCRAQSKSRVFHRAPAPSRIKKCFWMGERHTRTVVNGDFGLEYML